MLLLNNDDVKQVLTMDLTIRTLEAAYRELFQGEAICRPKLNFQVPTRDPSRWYNWSTTEGASSVSGYFAIRLMSDVDHEEEYEGARTREKFCVRPGLYCGLLFLTDIHTGEPLAMVHDGHLQHMRQGADGGIGAKHLALEDAEVVGMLGSGGMARSHAEAFCAVRKVRRIQVYSPTKANRERYAREMSARLGIEVVAVDEPRKAFAGAQILAGCTDSTRPVVIGRWLEDGMHVVDVGGKLDDEAMRRITLSLRFGDTPTPRGLPQWRIEGDNVFYTARAPGSIERTPFRGGPGARDSNEVQPGRLIGLADLWAGRATGRQSLREVTYSLRGGMRGIQFAALAGRVYELARAKGLGREIPTEWLLQDIRN